MTGSKPEGEGLAAWRRLLPHLELRKGVFVAATALTLLGVLFEGASAGLLIPTLEGAFRRDFGFLHESRWFGPALDRLPDGLATSDAALFGLLLGLCFLAVVLKLICQYTSTIILERQLQDLILQLRERVFARYLSFGKAYFDRHNLGFLSAQVMSYPHQVMAAASTLRMSLFQGLSVLAYLTLMAWISWELTLLVLGLFPALYLSLNRIVRQVRRGSQEYARANRSLSELVYTLLGGMPLVQATNQEEQEERRFAARAGEVAAIDVAQSQRMNLIPPLQELVVMAAILLLVAAAAYLFSAPEAGSLSSLLVFFYLLRRAATCFNQLSAARGSLARAGGALDDLLRVLEADPQPVVPDGPRPFPGVEREVRFEDLTFSYAEGEPALRSLTCSFERGETTAVVGKTGAGKSTLVQLLLRFYDVPPGTVLVDGVDIREFTKASLRARIAYVPQDPMLLDDTIRANVLYGCEREVTATELERVFERAHLDDLLARHPDGPDALVGDRGVKVSGGEKQRIALARAMLRDAELLILDEATSALDSRTEGLVQAAIEEALEGRTAVVIAHRLSTVRNADWVLVLSEGTLAEEGTPDQLLAKGGRFALLWEAQQFEGPAPKAREPARDEGLERVRPPTRGAAEPSGAD